MESSSLLMSNSMLFETLHSMHTRFFSEPYVCISREKKLSHGVTTNLSLYKICPRHYFCSKALNLDRNFIEWNLVIYIHVPLHYMSLWLVTCIFSLHLFCIWQYNWQFIKGGHSGRMRPTLHGASEMIKKWKWEEAHICLGTKGLGTFGASQPMRLGLGRGVSWITLLKCVA